MRGAVVFALAGVALAAPALAQARLLIDADDLRVSLEPPLRCAGTTHLEVEARRPDLLDGTSPRLQAVVDAARAVLAYECGAAPALEVTGRLRGLSSVSYRARADALDDWRLVPSQTALPTASENAAAPQPAPPAVPQPRYQVRSLTTGMTLDEALARSREAFDATPAYDAERRELTVPGDAARCGLRRESTPAVGERCLKARFTGGDDPRLFALGYVQSVAGEQAERVRRLLVESFGVPDVEQDVSRGGSSGRVLGWGRQVEMSEPGRTVRRHELRARIAISNDLTVVHVSLVDPDLASGGELAERNRDRLEF